MGPADAHAGARRAARPRPFRLRARWAAARRQSQGPVRAHIHDRYGRPRDRGQRLISTNPPAALFCSSYKSRREDSYGHQGRRQIAQCDVPRHDRGRAGQPKTTDEIFKGKKVVLFAVPGAFTPTCHKNTCRASSTTPTPSRPRASTPSRCTGVNDVFVMDAWKKASGAEGKIEFLADGNGEFAKAIELTLDGTRLRPRHALEALLDAGRGRRREGAQRRGRARQGRHLRRGGAAHAALRRRTGSPAPPGCAESPVGPDNAVIPAIARRPRPPDLPRSARAPVHRRAR